MCSMSHSGVFVSMCFNVTLAVTGTGLWTSSLKVGLHVSCCSHTLGPDISSKEDLRALQTYHMTSQHI